MRVAGVDMMVDYWRRRVRQAVGGGRIYPWAGARTRTLPRCSRPLMLY